MKFIFTIWFGIACTGQDSTASSENTSITAILKSTHTAGKSNAKGGESLPDLLKGLSRGGCEDGPGDNGAASFFYTDLTLDGENVSGKEQWLLFANKKWQQNNGADCVVKWNLTGTKVKPTACGDCDYGLKMVNAMNVTGSTCPKDMAKGETAQTIAYDVKVNKEGLAQLYFAASGKNYAQGYSVGNSLRVITDMSCRWF